MIFRTVVNSNKLLFVVKENGNFCLTSAHPGVILSECAFLRINLLK